MKRIFSVMLSLTVLMTCFVGLTFEVAAVTDDDPWVTELKKTETLPTADTKLRTKDGTTTNAGTSTNPYVIEKSVDFMYIEIEPAASYILVADIEVGHYSENEGEWIKFTQPFAFQGDLTGWDENADAPTHRTISLNIEAVAPVGLFKTYVRANTSSKISYIEIKGRVRGSSGNYVGGFVGQSDSGNGSYFLECINRAEVSSTTSGVGGIGGRISSGTMEYCENYGNITGNTIVGGIAGEGGNILYSNNFGTVKGLSGNAGMGGIVGKAYGNITGCYNMGELDATSLGTSTTNGVGGIVGNGAGGSKKYSSCYNFGKIKVNNQAVWRAGILGRVGAASITVENCFDFLSGAKHPIVDIEALATNLATLTATTNNYFVKDADVTLAEDTPGTEKTIAQFLSWSSDSDFNLGGAFSKATGELGEDIWQFPDITANPNTSDYRMYKVDVTTDDDGTNGTVTVSVNSGAVATVTSASLFTPVYMIKGEAFTISVEVAPKENIVGNVFLNGQSKKQNIKGAPQTYTLTGVEISKHSEISVTFVELVPQGDLAIPTGMQVFSTPVATDVTIQDHNGLDFTITSETKYGVVFCKVEENFSGWELVEYGVSYWKDDPTAAKDRKAKVVDLTSGGGYGILFYGSGMSGTYYVKAYAIYKDALGSELVPVYGSETLTFDVAE